MGPVLPCCYLLLRDIPGNTSQCHIYKAIFISLTTISQNSDGKSLCKGTDRLATRHFLSGDGWRFTIESDDFLIYSGFLFALSFSVSLGLPPLLICQENYGKPVCWLAWAICDCMRSQISCHRICNAQPFWWKDVFLTALTVFQALPSYRPL